jgi:hypothetical protein
VRILEIERQEEAQLLVLGPASRVSHSLPLDTVGFKTTKAVKIVYTLRAREVIQPIDPSAYRDLAQFLLVLQ